MPSTRNKRTTTQTSTVESFSNETTDMLSVNVQSIHNTQDDGESVNEMHAMQVVSNGLSYSANHGNLNVKPYHILVIHESSICEVIERDQHLYIHVTMPDGQTASISIRRNR